MAVIKYNTMPDAMTTCLTTESNMKKMKKQQEQEGTKPLSEVFEFYPVEDVTTDTCTHTF